jgi:hypothetical protein
MASSDEARPSRRMLLQSMAAVAAATVGGTALAHGGPPAIKFRPIQLFKLEQAIVYRLRTRKTRACRACRRHHQRTIFRSHAIANANRAHQGCDCPIIPQAISKGLFKKLFPRGSKGVAMLPCHPRERRD